MSEREIERYAKKKSDLQMEIEDLEKQRAAIIAQKKQLTKKYYSRIWMKIKSLPPQ